MEERMKMEISEGMVSSESDESAEKDLIDIKMRNERNTHIWIITDSNIMEDTNNVV